MILRASDVWYTLIYVAEIDHCKMSVCNSMWLWLQLLYLYRLVGLYI